MVERADQEVAMRPRMLTVLLLAFAGLALAGCGGGDGEEAAPAETADTAAETETGAETGAGEAPAFETISPGVLSIGSDIPFPPFEYREGDELTGFDVELMEEIASRLGLETEWTDTSFDTIFTQLAAGRFDAVASATTITDEREQQVDFTEPYYVANQALTVNVAQTPELDDTGDLSEGDTVAVQRGTTGEIWARENLPDGVQVRSFPEAPDTYTALEAGNVTAVIFDEPSAIAEAEARDDLEVTDVIDTGERYGFPVNPENDALREAINAALEEIIADGTYQRLYEMFPDLPPGGSIAEAEIGG